MMKKPNDIMFTAFKVGHTELKNRFVMAPMTRSRASQPDDLPTADTATYYAQRASAGLIITEATQISLQGKGYAGTPGIYTQAQIEAWRLVTDAVHAKGSKIFSQLWHVGRVSSSKVTGLQPLAPSAIIAKDTVTFIFKDGAYKPTPVEMPRAMTIKEIHATIVDFQLAAENAIRAGFDGIEIHAGNGYLLDQFLRGTTNQRDDEYGGTPERRMRLILDVTKGIADLIGKHRVGVRVSPFITYKDMKDEDVLDQIIMLAAELDRMGIAYLHLAEADWDDAPQIPDSFREKLRAVFKKPIIVAGNKTPESGAELINKHYVDLIGFGRKFMVNPDYPVRVLREAPLNEFAGRETVFGGNNHGYIDYKSLELDHSKKAKQ